MLATPTDMFATLTDMFATLTDMFATLQSVGYQNGTTLRAASYDWRLFGDRYAMSTGSGCMPVFPRTHNHAYYMQSCAVEQCDWYEGARFLNGFHFYFCSGAGHHNSLHN